MAWRLSVVVLEEKMLEDGPKNQLLGFADLLVRCLEKVKNILPNGGET